MKETSTNRVRVSAIVLSVACAGLAIAAAAQVRTTPPTKLFFEGDIVKHRVQGQQGPCCVLQSQFRRGEAIAWRMSTIVRRARGSHGQGPANHRD
jgi:hypothetical protein